MKSRDLLDITPGAPDSGQSIGDIREGLPQLLCRIGRERSIRPRPRVPRKPYRLTDPDRGRDTGHVEEVLPQRGDDRITHIAIVSPDPFVGNACTTCPPCIAKVDAAGRIDAPAHAALALVPRSGRVGLDCRPVRFARSAAEDVLQIRLTSPLRQSLASYVSDWPVSVKGDVVFWSIVEVARMSGVTARTLRHYDEIGLSDADIARIGRFQSHNLSNPLNRSRRATVALRATAKPEATRQLTNAHNPAEVAISEHDSHGPDGCGRGRSFGLIRRKPRIPLWLGLQGADANLRRFPSFACAACLPSLSSSCSVSPSLSVPTDSVVTAPAIPVARPWSVQGSRQARLVWSWVVALVAFLALARHRRRNRILSCLVGAQGLMLIRLLASML